MSKIVGDRWTIHFNAGMSNLPRRPRSLADLLRLAVARDVRGHDLTNYNLGGSGIYAVTRDFNLMLEMVAGWNEEVDFAVKTARVNVNRTTTALISPGFRYAFNCPNDLQIVAGAAAPIGITCDSPLWGLFFYLSFEHAFLHPRGQM